MYKEYIDKNDSRTQKELSTRLEVRFDYLSCGDLIVWFEKMANQFRDKIAVKEVSAEGSHKQITYGELYELSDCIANRLLESAIENDETIILYIKNRIYLSIAVWGVIKSGGTYLIINPDESSPHISILRDAHPGIISDEQLEITDGFSNVWYINENLVSHRTLLPKIKREMDGLLYGVLTSGTLGVPKEVMIKQASLLNTVYWRIRQYNYNEDNITLPVLNSSFGAFSVDFFASILSGGTLICLGSGIRGNYKKIIEIIKTCSVTNISITPTNLYNMMNTDNEDIFDSLDFIIAGGEMVRPQYLELFFSKYKNVKLFHEYGSAENSVITTCKQITGPECSGIGKEIDNTKIYILNDGRVSNKGEFYIAGVGVSPGYLYNQDISSRTFIDNPFQHGAKLYKTGDLGYRDESGCLYITGRSDKKIKIHGYLIDLEEIESCLSLHDKIQQSYVYVSANESGHQSIHVFVMPKDSKETIDEFEICTYIKEHLHYKEIPLKIIQTNNIQINSLDKNNQKNFLYSRIYYDINDLWKQLLRQDELDPDQDFFELGGNSLILMEMFFSINQKYPDTIKLSDIFDHMTINKLSAYILRNLS